MHFYRPSQMESIEAWIPNEALPWPHLLDGPCEPPCSKLEAYAALHFTARQPGSNAAKCPPMGSRESLNVGACRQHGTVLIVRAVQDGVMGRSICDMLWAFEGGFRLTQTSSRKKKRRDEKGFKKKPHLKPREKGRQFDSGIFNGGV